MPPQRSFDPTSLDSTISHILTRLDEQDRTQARMHEENKTLLGGLKSDFDKFAGSLGRRMTSLEKWRWGIAGAVGLFGLMGTAAIIYEAVKK